MKRLLLLSVSLLLFLVMGHAQKYILDSLAPKAFFYEEHNTLLYADSSDNFRVLFSRLDSIYRGHQGNLHIMHIGGSHVQADAYPNKLRAYLQNMNEVAMGQRGFVFPYNVAKTNNPLNYRIDGTKSRWKGHRSPVWSESSLWGLSGISLELISDIDTLRIKANYKEVYGRRATFNKVRFFVDPSRTGWQINPADTLNSIVNRYYDQEQGYVEFTLDRYTETADFEVKAERLPELEPLVALSGDQIVPDTALASAKAGFLLLGMELMSDSPGIQYTSLGVNGASFDTYYRCTLFEDQLMLYKPDLFIITIGTNDANTTNFDSLKFASNYERMIDMVLRANPQCALLFVVPNDSYFKRKYPNPNTQIQADIIHKLAVKHRQAAWDFYKVMGGLGSSHTWWKHGMMQKDRIHFTATGYSLMADLLLKALVSKWETLLGAEEEHILNAFTRHEQN